WGPQAKEQFDDQIGRVLPRDKNPIIDLPMDHPIWHTQFELTHLPQMSSIQSWRRTGGGVTERGLPPGRQSARAVVDEKGRIMVVMIHDDDIPDGWEREGEGAAVKSAGMNYVHLPFDPQNPDAHLIDNFIAAVTATQNQPAYVHCAAGGRAASLWMVKRVLADGWDEQRALTEANALGLNDRFRPFALNYIHAHGR
ncbi:MAG: hypothetical protein DMF88_26970, partial [Acidobacteria bacterium]